MTGYMVLRSTVRPAIAARINLESFYCIGTPMVVGLAFGLKVVSRVVVWVVVGPSCLRYVYPVCDMVLY
ncbi:hypothetical protein LINPERHAP1_LOCUS25004 [Linum perenne]